MARRTALACAEPANAISIMSAEEQPLLPQHREGETPASVARKERRAKAVKVLESRWLHMLALTLVRPYERLPNNILIFNVQLSLTADLVSVVVWVSAQITLNLSVLCWNENSSPNS